MPSVSTGAARGHEHPPTGRLSSPYGVLAMMTLQAPTLEKQARPHGAPASTKPGLRTHPQASGSESALASARQLKAFLMGCVASLAHSKEAKTQGQHPEPVPSCWARAHPKDIVRQGRPPLAEGGEGAPGCSLDDSRRIGEKHLSRPFRPPAGARAMTYQAHTQHTRGGRYNITVRRLCAGRTRVLNEAG